MFLVLADFRYRKVNLCSPAIEQSAMAALKALKSTNSSPTRWAWQRQGLYRWRISMRAVMANKCEGDGDDDGDGDGQCKCDG